MSRLRYAFLSLPSVALLTANPIAVAQVALPLVSTDGQQELKSSHDKATVLYRVAPETI